MGQRGRVSGAALSVVAGTEIDGRPKAPSDLSDFQAEVWDRTVANEASDVFRTAALQQLLKEYCRHVETADRLSKQVDRAMCEGSNLSLQEIDTLLRMRDRETKALADKATKLRLTNQSRYTPGAAGTAAKKGGTEKKPWQMTG
jgi:hypothetical protein